MKNFILFVVWITNHNFVFSYCSLKRDVIVHRSKICVKTRQLLCQHLVGCFGIGQQMEFRPAIFIYIIISRKNYLSLFNCHFCFVTAHMCHCRFDGLGEWFIWWARAVS